MQLRDLPPLQTNVHLRDLDQAAHHDQGQRQVRIGIPLQDLPWKLPIRHLSASSLKVAATCPEQWRRKYLLKEPDRWGGALVLGSAFHAGVAAAMEQKRGGRGDDPLAVYAQTFQRDSQKNDVDWSSADPKDVFDKGLAMTSKYLTDVAPRLEPISVEERISIRVEGLPVPIIGFVDLVTPNTIVDYKTSARKVTGPKAGWLPQAFIYQLAKPKRFEWHVVTKTKEPECITPLEQANLTVDLNVAALANTQVYLRDLAWTLNYLYLTKTSEQPWPTTGVVIDGECKRCASRSTCPIWKR